MIAKFIAWLGTLIVKLMIQATIDGLYRDRAKITGCTPVDHQHKNVIDQDITQLEGALRELAGKARVVRPFIVIKEK